MLRVACFIVFLELAALAAQSQGSVQKSLEYEHPTVTILNGTLSGIHLESLKQDIFLGIPFAKSPVGSLRFRHPEPLDQKWPGTFQATKYGHSCSQYSNTTDISEDCLTLNGKKHSQVIPASNRCSLPPTQPNILFQASSPCHVSSPFFPPVHLH